MALALPQLVAPASWQSPDSPRSYLPVSALQSIMEGVPRGAISELLGDASSGRTTFVQAFLAASTALGEVCAVVDSANAFDPVSAARAGVDLSRLLWVQCNGRVEHAMKVADLILHSGGFGLVVLDLCDVPAEALQRIPVSYWHRFRLAIKNTNTALVVAGQQANARSCAALQLELSSRRPEWARPGRFQRLSGLDLYVHSRKPVHCETARLRAWAVSE